MMKYNITHRTLYEYAAPVTVSHHVTRLEPRDSATQSAGKFSLTIYPEPALHKVRSDYFGNRLCFFAIQEIHNKLEIVAHSRVIVTKPQIPKLDQTPEWETVAEMFRDPVSPQDVNPYQFVFDSPMVRVSEQLAEYAEQSFAADTPLLVGAADLTRRIFRDFKYDPVATTVATPLEEVWRTRRGVCQDFAHLAIACLRSIGLPAGYVSGYLRTLPPKGQPRLVGADASHAWFRVFCPGAGWVEFDPTNNLMPGEEHVTLALGRDFSDVSPVAGILTGGGKHEVKVSVDVEPLD